MITVRRQSRVIDSFALFASRQEFGGDQGVVAGALGSQSERADSAGRQPTIERRRREAKGYHRLVDPFPTVRRAAHGPQQHVAVAVHYLRQAFVDEVGAEFGGST